MLVVRNVLIAWRDSGPFGDLIDQLDGSLQLETNHYSALTSMIYAV